MKKSQGNVSDTEYILWQSEDLEVERKYEYRNLKKVELKICKL